MTEPLTYDLLGRRILDENGLAVGRDIPPDLGFVMAAAPRLREAARRSHRVATRDPMTAADCAVHGELEGLLSEINAEEYEADNPAAQADRRIKVQDGPNLWAILDEMLAYEAQAFEHDEEVNGGDMVEQFAIWRDQLKISLDRARPPTVRVLLAATADLLDEALTEHIYDAGNGEKAPVDCPYVVARNACRDFAGDTRSPQRIGITVQGGVIQSIFSDRPVVGVDVTVFDFDAEGDDDDVEMVRDADRLIPCNIETTAAADVDLESWPDVVEEDAPQPEINVHIAPELMDRIRNQVLENCEAAILANVYPAELVLLTKEGRVVGRARVEKPTDQHSVMATETAFVQVFLCKPGEVPTWNDSALGEDVVKNVAHVEEPPVLTKI